MYAFVDQYAGQAPQDSPLQLLYFSLYRDLLDAAAIACRDYRNDRDKAVQCIQIAMAKYTTPKLGDEVLVALRLYDQAPYEFGLTVQPILFDMLQNYNADSYAGAMLQLTATAMHSDTTLKDDGPDANDYVIDRALAETWRQKGVLDAAIKKTQKALQDVNNASYFPDQEARDVTLGLVYKDMAMLADRHNQYSDMIAYETASIQIGGPNDYEHAICYGLQQLKQDADAVRSCSQAIADQPNDLYAYYWRGLAYNASMQPDAALSDLAIVAAWDNNFRAEAAIKMSLIDFDRDDNAAALDVLNKYDFLYDPNTQSKSTVATAYNNRCYAYMQLGDLEKALGDCTASLKYGSIPDAYRKQQELARLGDRTSDHHARLTPSRPDDHLRRSSRVRRGANEGLLTEPFTAFTCGQRDGSSYPMANLQLTRVIASSWRHRKLASAPGKPCDCLVASMGHEYFHFLGIRRPRPAHLVA
jgi:tetratricopeptide (TPR) repeat protein